MVIAWFSCGATSAVACKIALTMYADVRIVYIETGSGHPDNERFIQDCLQHHIRLIMIESPMYVCSREDVFRFPRELAAKYKVPFLDHYRDPDFVGHADLFFDFGHLNRQGAERYSAKIAKELKTLLP